MYLCIYIYIDTLFKPLQSSRTLRGRQRADPEAPGLLRGGDHGRRAPGNSPGPSGGSGAADLGGVPYFGVLI